jgi:hypothetical protein
MFVKKSVNIKRKKKKEIMKRNFAKLLVKASSLSYREKILESINFKTDINGPPLLHLIEVFIFKIIYTEN